MAITLRDAIGRLNGIKARLGSPDEFWTGRKEEYREILAQATVRELTPLKPVDMEAEEWAYHVNLLAAGIAAELLTETENGLKFGLGGAQPQMREIAGDAPGIFSQDTVMQWIQAGREGDPEGKHLDERDAGRSNLQIAQRVWFAMYTGRSLHSHELIRKFLEARGVQFVQEALPALLTAWKESLIVRLMEDWKKYVAAVACGGTIAPF